MRHTHTDPCKGPLKDSEIAAIDHGPDHVRVSCERVKIEVLEGKIKRNKKKKETKTVHKTK